MKLLVDIGNTRIKWALLGADGLEQPGDVVHRTDPAGAIATMLNRVTAPPRTIHVANVAGSALGAAVSAALGAHWNLPVEFAETQASTGEVRNAYSDHRMLGVDRWLAILAGVERYPGALCIVDAGTAITVDLVAAGGAHLGGYIVPGIDLMWSALVSDTGDLARSAGADSRRPPGSIEAGRDTAAAIAQGGLAMHCAWIEHCVRKLTADNKPPVLLMTGGDAPRILAHLETDSAHRPQLVLEGLALYAADR